MTEHDVCVEVELAVMGSLVKFFSSLHSSMLLLTEDDFVVPELRQVLTSIKGLPPDTDLAIIASRVPVDCRPVMIRSLEYVIGEHEFQSQLNRLLQISQSRRIKRELTELTMAPVEVTVDHLVSIIERETPKGTSCSAIKKSDGNIDKFVNNFGKMQPRIQTGYHDIDRVAGGLRIPAVSIIGALPSTGKTAFALNIARNQKQPVLFFSLEMSTEMLYERITSDALSIDYNLFSTQKVNGEQVKSAKEYIKNLKPRFYAFDDIRDIEQQAAIIREVKPQLVVVDYIQKVQTVKRCQDRRNEIEHISGQYKHIANYNNCHVMLLSQLSRVPSKNRKEPPTMADLKESGALEADGDYVMLLHRPYVIDKKGDPQECILKIDKNKFGGTGRVDLSFIGKYQRFTGCYKTDDGSRAELPF